MKAIRFRKAANQDLSPDFFFFVFWLGVRCSVATRTPTSSGSPVPVAGEKPNAAHGLEEL